MRFGRFQTSRGLTVIELLAVVAVVAVLLTVAAPALTQLIATQRLRGINAELMSNLQYARSTAVSRQIGIYVRFKQTPSMSCYVLYSGTGGVPCDCTRPPGSVCTSPIREIRTTQVIASTDVKITPSSVNPINFNTDGMTNSNFVLTTTRISGAPGQFVVTINSMGRPTACYSAGSGTPSC